MAEAEEVPESGGKKGFARRVLLEGPLRPYPLLFGRRVPSLRDCY